MLFNKPDIVTTIEPYVNLKKAGQLYKGPCPFHAEKTPSFFVNPSRQRFHCFGCGADGDAIQFVMDYHKLSFKTALDFLGINGKPSKKNFHEILRVKRKRELAEQFRQWSAEYCHDLWSLFRCLRKAKQQIKDESALEALVPFYHQEPLWLHHFEILQGNDDKEKLNLYREVAYGE